MSTGETITEEELAAALKSITHLGDIIPCGLCTDRAAAIFEYVKTHCEPEYEPGAVVRDRLGIVYVRDHETRHWLRAGRGGRSCNEDLSRPLERLAPEGSQAAKPTREQVFAVLRQRSTVGTAEAAADDIMKLLEAHGEH